MAFTSATRDCLAFSVTTRVPIITCGAAPTTFAPLHTAMRLLERYPDIAHADFYTAVVCGELDAVSARWPPIRAGRHA